MKWIPFFILAAITIVLQTAVAPHLAIQGIWPDLMFILAVHYALWGPWPDAAIAAWLLGLLVDLQSLNRVGLMAFLYGGAVWAIMYIRQVVFRESALTQIVITLVFAFAIQVLSGLYLRWSSMEPIIGGMWLRAFWIALFTAACTPYLHWLLMRMEKWTGLRGQQRSLSLR